MNDKFKTKIKEIVENEQNWKLNNNIPPEDTIEGYYYIINDTPQNVTETEIFQEIRRGKYRRQLNTTNSKYDGILYAHFENDINKMLISIKNTSDNYDIHKKEFERMMKLFVENEDLKTMVKLHEELIDELHNNEDRKKFIDSINKLYDNIVVNSGYIEGECDECKFRKRLSLK